ncbi:MAG TPA: lactate utilization protein [Thermopetrobacter sp.]|nr:lactate utilization protein [Thermopetrobacter sp.]
MTAPSDARAALLARLAAACAGRHDADAVTERLRDHPRGPRPRPADPADSAELLVRFLETAEKAGARTDVLSSPREVPAGVAAILRHHDLPPRFWLPAAEHDADLAALDWAGAGLAPAAHPPPCEDDAFAAVTPAAAAIAETGSCVFATSAAHPAAAAFLPRVHIVVLSAGRIVAGLDDVRVMLRASAATGTMPRAVNWVTGPSRTADIEQTLVEGAHGPAALHILALRET